MAPTQKLGQKDYFETACNNKIEMSDTTPLYNSRITKVYLEYLEKKYSDLDVEFLLDHAGISKEELEDQAHWLTQTQVDRFQEAAIKLTGNPDLAREVGRYAGSSESIGIAKHFILGLTNLSSLYTLVSKAYNAFFSKAVTIQTNRTGTNQMEIVATPLPGVNEKPYQCQNRIGMFESVARLFFSKMANIKELACFHKGDEFCHYLITWETNVSYTLKKIRNILLLSSAISCSILFFLLSFDKWVNISLLLFLISAISSAVTGHFEKKELANTLETQGNLAEDLLGEMEIRHNNALLIQEIGQAVSSILDVDLLMQRFVKSMQTHMNFDRGLIFLHDTDRKQLVYKAGYGYSREKEDLLHRTTFDLTNPHSKGAFVQAYKGQEPLLLNNPEEIRQKLSSKSLDFAEQMEGHSLICVPIVYEYESLGILAVDNIKSNKPLTKSDVSFILGVSSQMAISIINALSYQKLEESEKKYRDLVENANSIILRRDINGQIIFFNEFTQKFFGFSETDIFSNNLEEAIFQNHTTNPVEFEMLIESLKQNANKQIISENQVQLPDKERAWITWTYNPILDTSGNLKEILCIGNDITDLKKSEFEKEELQIRLQRAQKMEAIGTLAGGVAHDLNNILSGIVSYPDLLLMDLPPDSRMRKPITTIQKAGERAAAIVQDLLTLARRGVVTKKVVNLNNLINDYVDSPEYESLKSHYTNYTLNVDLEDNLLNISGSPVHLTKTIMNLVMNAAEAITDTGSITIQTRNEYVDRSINGFDKVKEGNYVTVVVSDTGIGIAPKDIERIFEPFYTKKIMGKSGTGLGMAVVWGTIKDHNGFIDVKSSEGKGTVFTLYFPVSRKHVMDTEEEAASSEITGNGEKVLVIDDVEEQREIALDILKKLGYSAVALSSGEEAILYLKNNSADLLVLDMILEGGMDGLDTYKKILEINPNQKTIIVSGFSESTRVKETQKLGAGAYIKKPYRIEDIGKAIKTEFNR